VTDKDDPSGWRDGGFDDTDDVGNRQTRKQRPHGKVLEAGRRGRELIAQSVVLHVDTDKVVESGSGETKNARDLLSVEEVGGFVPVDPHATEIVAEQVVKRVSRKETQTVRNPVCLAGSVVVIGLGTLPQFADGFSALLICARPNTKSDTVESVRRILLEDECMVDTVRLHGTSTDFNVVRETCPHGSVKGAGNVVVLLQSRAASQNLRKPELTNGTLHVSNLSLRRWRSLDPLRGLAADTTYHVGMGKSLWCTLTITRLG
jgi:hypothetical protein